MLNKLGSQRIGAEPTYLVIERSRRDMLPVWTKFCGKHLSTVSREEHNRSVEVRRPLHGLGQL